MKTLKLEVGKTYRSRNGEEVKIVEKGRSGKFPYKSNDGRRYAENGRFTYYAGETPYDLVEEIPSETTRHIFTIPDGVKELTVRQVGNRIVVEMVPEAKGPKPGDIVFEDGRIMIVKKYPNLYHAMIHGNPDYLHINGSYGIPFTSATFRPATAEEAQPLFDALKKAGKKWNPETMQVEEIPEIDRIREWMDMNIKCGGEVVNIAEVIESYLNQKEAK